MSDLRPDAPGGNPEKIRGLYESRDLEAIAGRWNARAANWDRELSDPDCHLNHDGAYLWFLETVHRLIDERSEFCSRNGVIDNGCGTGLVLAAVAPRFSWGTGVDVSPMMIELARQKNISGCQFIVGDSFRLPEICGKAGAVFSRGVLLSHYGHEQGVVLLKAMRATLADGGFMACDFLNESARSTQIHAPEHKTYYLRESVISMAIDAGFRDAVVLGGEDRRALMLVAQV